jgi:signal transduction histidine kinase
LDSFPGALQQVLLQLVENAVPHAFEGRGGAIAIVAGTAGEGWLELSVSADGGGIPAAHFGRVFEPFFTIKMGVGGSSLGLSAADNIVTGVLGGRITIESADGRGSRFTITLPAVAPRA